LVKQHLTRVEKMNVRTAGLLHQLPLTLYHAAIELMVASDHDNRFAQADSRKRS